jgi:hypothetical protein
MIQNETCIIEFQLKGEPVQERYYLEADAWIEFYKLCEDPNINYARIARLTVKHLKYYHSPPTEPLTFDI